MFYYKTNESNVKEYIYSAQMTDSSDYEDARDAFDEYAQHQKNKMKTLKVSQSDIEGETQKQIKKVGKTSKEKKSKKKKQKKIKKKNRYDSQQRSYDYDIKDMIQSEAEQDSNQEQQEYQRSQIDRDYKHTNYDLQEPKTMEKFMNRFTDKNQQQINRLYNKKVRQSKMQEGINFRKADHQLFSIKCQKGMENELIMNILNKARYCAQNQQSQHKCYLTSLFCQKKKYPGTIFIEAENQKQIRQSIGNFIGLRLNSIKVEGKQVYSSFVSKEVQKKTSFQQKQFIRIKTGYYKGDLGQIHKIYKHRLSVLLVPRIDFRLILAKIKAQQKKHHFDDEQARNNQIFKEMINYKRNFKQNERIKKSNIDQAELKAFDKLQTLKKMLITDTGLVIFMYGFEEVQKPVGGILPIELLPYSKTGNIVEEFKNQGEEIKLFLGINLKIGEQVQITAGQLAGLYGQVVECDKNKVVIKSRTPKAQAIMITEITQNVKKRFVSGSRVRVVLGNYKGSEGIVMDNSSPSTLKIMTNNLNEIQVNKINVEIMLDQISLEAPPSLYKINDIIKTGNGNIGIICQLGRDYVKMLAITNTIHLVNNLDIQLKYNSRNSSLIGLNKQLIRVQQNVRIFGGERQGKICEVRQIYQGYVFLYNYQFTRTNFLCVQRAQNCVVISQKIFRNKQNNKQNSKERR